MTPKERFALFIAEGHAKDPRKGTFRSLYEVARILDIPQGTLRDWITKDHPEWAEAVRVRGPKTKAENAAKKEAVVALLSSGGHRTARGSLIPCYLLADRLGISPNTLMKWASEVAPDVAALWKEGHCNPFNPDDPDITETRRKQRASVKKHRQYARRVNSRRVNKLKRELLP